jgi:hypothetical protein
VQADESFDEGFRARLAKAPLRRTLAFTEAGLTLGAGAIIAKMTTDARGRPAGLALEGEAKTLFQRLTTGQSVTTEEDKYGNTKTSTSDQRLNLRIKVNGDVRIDRPVDIGGKDRETIHFNKR